MVSHPPSIFVRACLPLPPIDVYSYPTWILSLLRLSLTPAVNDRRVKQWYTLTDWGVSILRFIAGGKIQRVKQIIFTGWWWVLFSLFIECQIKLLPFFSHIPAVPVPDYIKPTTIIMNDDSWFITCFHRYHSPYYILLQSKRILLPDFMFQWLA